DADSAVKAADAIGYPVTVKVSGCAHKTESDGVRLDLADGDAVFEAASALSGSGKALLVERMAGKPIVELVAGVTRDPEYGLLMTLGAGGVWTEILRDTASLLLPVTREELRAALESLRIAPLLH